VQATASQAGRRRGGAPERGQVRLELGQLVDLLQAPDVGAQRSDLRQQPRAAVAPVQAPARAGTVQLMGVLIGLQHVSASLAGSRRVRAGRMLAGQVRCIHEVLSQTVTGTDRGSAHQLVSQRVVAQHAQAPRVLRIAAERLRRSGALTSRPKYSSNALATRVINSD